MNTTFKQLFENLFTPVEELETETKTETGESPDYENEWEYHEYLKRLEAEDYEEYDLWSEYPFK